MQLSNRRRSYRPSHHHLSGSGMLPILLAGREPDRLLVERSQQEQLRHLRKTGRSRRACPNDQGYVEREVSGLVARRQLNCLPSPVGRSSSCHRADALARTGKPKGSSPDERPLVDGGLEYSSWTAFGMVARQQISLHGGRGWRECKLQKR